MIFSSLPPTSWPNVTFLPPPEITPLSIVRFATGTPRLVEARPSSDWRASAPTLRIFGPVPDIAFEPPSPPVEPATQVSTTVWLLGLNMPYRICDMSASSSSASTCRKPVVIPLPVSIWLVLSTIVSSALIVIHESTWFRSGLNPAAVGGVAGNAADALPARADPAIENPMISAPPPFTKLLRESSFSCRLWPFSGMSPVIRHLPLPSRPRPSGSR